MLLSEAQGSLDARQQVRHGDEMVLSKTICVLTRIFASSIEVLASKSVHIDLTSQNRMLAKRMKSH